MNIAQGHRQRALWKSLQNGECIQKPKYKGCNLGGWNSFQNFLGRIRKAGYEIDYTLGPQAGFTNAHFFLKDRRKPCEYCEVTFPNELLPKHILRLVEGRKR